MKRSVLAGSLGVVTLALALWLTLSESAQAGGRIVLTILLWLGGLALLLLAILYTLPGPRKHVNHVAQRIRRVALHPRKPGNQNVDTKVLTNTIRAKNKQMNLFVEDLVKHVPATSATSHYSPIDAKAAVVCDDRTFLFLDGIITDATRFDLGNKDLPTGDSWDLLWFIVDSQISQAQRDNVDLLLSWATREDVPVLLNFEADIAHIDRVEVIARSAAAVFTPYSEHIQTIADRAGHDRIYVGQFGANPIHHNPVGSARVDLDAAIHFGRYSSDNLRPTTATMNQRDTKDLLAAFSQRGQLLISDDQITGATSSFPDRYAPYAMAPLAALDQIRAAKLFAYNIVLSTEVESDSGYNRLLDAQACLGKGTLSNYTVSVFNQVPLARIIPAAVNASGLLTDRGRADSDVLSQHFLAECMLNRNGFKRVADMLSHGRNVALMERPRRILVIGVGDIDIIRRNFDRQLYKDAILIEDRPLIAEDLDGIGYVASMSSDYTYGPNYLSGRLAAFMYTDSVFVSQRGGYAGTIHADGPVHDYTDHTTDRFVTMVSTSNPEALNFIMGGSDRLEAPGYLVDHWEVNYDTYIGHVTRQIEQEPLLSVVIPIYNNGRYLFSKALPSLRINESWPQMEVLLIDDGSSDEFTLQLCQDLARIYPNIRYFSFADGGSGSASRPRNKGVEMASAPLVTYLDPDNEISMFGYDRLLMQYQQEKENTPELDFVSGYQLKVSTWRGGTGRHAPQSRLLVTDFKKHFFNKGDFPVVSTQCAVISRDFLLKSQLRFVENAIGQDTLYGWELALKARSGLFVDDAYLIYYADRADSVTNAVGKKYFSRVLINEIEKERVLREHEILEIYKESHLTHFMTHWYLPRLARVPQTEYDEARRDLNKIAELYGFDLEYFEKVALNETN